MKSTYDLIGVFWDGRPAIPSAKTMPYNPLIPEAGMPYCLFDIDCKQRSIPLSKLFATQSDKDWEQIKLSLTDCNQIIVIDDCRPQFNSTVVQQFHERRFGQVIYLLQVEVPNAQLFITMPPIMERAA